MSGTELRLFLGGSRHGQLLITPADASDRYFPVPGGIGFEIEVYVAERIYLFGYMVPVMVTSSRIEDPFWVRDLAAEFLMSSLARALTKE